jgi:hypothetical protein
MATVRFTDDDRDSRGFIRLSQPPEDTTPVVAPSVASPPIRRAAPAPDKRVAVPRGLIVLASGGLIGLLLIATTIRFGAVPGRISPRLPASTATVQSSTPAPVAAATAAAPGVAMADAYAAPNGARLGAIEATRAITPTAHYGGDWIQADVQGSGVIWLKASDWPALAIVGPDLAPRPTATARPYVSPTPEPQPPCLTAGTGAQVVTVCDWLTPEQLNAAAAAKWIATYGGNAGIVTTPTPYGGTK